MVMSKFWLCNQLMTWFFLQFVELKGSVFKKFDKNNLFQVSCSDVRERLHLSVLLFIVVLQTMKEYTWKEERFWILAPDCVLVLTFEVIIDWVKHAFITRQVFWFHWVCLLRFVWVAHQGAIWTRLEGKKHAKIITELLFIKHLVAT